MTSNELAVTYAANGEDITVTANDVRNVLGAPTATDAEVRIFLELCKAQGLNPWIKEAHIIKFRDNPATMVVGKDVFTKRAQKNPKFRGFQAGITFVDQNGQLQRREGSMLLPGEQVIGGWCAVYVDGYEKPMKDEVSFAEYAGRKRDGSLNQQWSSKPATMIRKVAIVHALREAFPDDFQGLYDEAEMGNLEPPREAMDVKAEIVTSATADEAYTDPCGPDEYVPTPVIEAEPIIIDRNMEEF